MHYEYAVDPATITEDWKTCRYIAELFGFDRGRLLSQYPKRWLPQAIDAAAHLPPREKQRVIEKLRRLKEHASIRSGRAFDPSSGDWLENALTQHAITPFRAIMAGNGASGPPALVELDDVSEIHPLFEVARSARIPRDAADITAAVAPLISCARRALLVDKYYDPFNSKYQHTLRELLKIADANVVDFEIHYCEHGRCPEALSIEREAHVKFSGVIPDGMSIKLVRWRERTGGRNFHARYLLTDRGGIGVDAGFSSEGAHQATDIQLLETPFALATVTELESTTSPYEQVGPTLKINNRGLIERS